MCFAAQLNIFDVLINRIPVRTPTPPCLCLDRGHKAGHSEYDDDEDQAGISGSNSDKEETADDRMKVEEVETSEETEHSDGVEFTMNSVVALLNNAAKHQTTTKSAAQLAGTYNFGLMCTGPSKVIDCIVLGDQMCPQKAIISVRPGVFYRNGSVSKCQLENLIKDWTNIHV